MQRRGIEGRVRQAGSDGWQAAQAAGWPVGSAEGTRHSRKRWLSSKARRKGRSKTRVGESDREAEPEMQHPELGHLVRQAGSDGWHAAQAAGWPAGSAEGARGRARVGSWIRRRNRKVEQRRKPAISTTVGSEGRSGREPGSDGRSGWKVERSASGDRPESWPDDKLEGASWREVGRQVRGQADSASCAQVQRTGPKGRLETQVESTAGRQGHRCSRRRKLGTCLRQVEGSDGRRESAVQLEGRA